MKKFKIWLAVVVIVALTIMLARVFFINFDMAAEDFAQVMVKNHVTSLFYTSFNQKINQNMTLLSEVIRIERGKNDRITAIFVNTITLNLFASALILDVTEKITAQQQSFGIPLGNASGVRLLSGVGPRIGVKIQPVGNITANVQNDFQSTGINQSLHRVYIEICAAIGVMTPFSNHTSEIRCSFVVAETVIIGEIPYVYLN